MGSLWGVYIDAFMGSLWGVYIDDFMGSLWGVYIDDFMNELAILSVRMTHFSNYLAQFVSVIYHPYMLNR